MPTLTRLTLALGLALQLALASCATAPPETGTDCNKRPSCVKYLTKLKKRVFRAWKPSDDVQGGVVTVSFRIDPEGLFKDIRVLRSDSEPLAVSCKQAMQDATRLPRVPEGLAFLLRQKLVATFAFERKNSR